MIFVTADPHLGHENIILYCGRPYATAAEMDEDIIGGINRAVGPKDVLVVNGDFMVTRVRSPEEYADKFLAYAARITCKNVLWVGGNHDYFSIPAHGDHVPNFALLDALRWQCLCPCGRVRLIRDKNCRHCKTAAPGRPLDAVHPAGFEWRLTPKTCADHGLTPAFAGRLVVFGHYAHRVWNKSHRPDRSVMLYGHSHGHLPGIKNSFDCGWDVWKRPLSLQEILADLMPTHNQKRGII